MAKTNVSAKRAPNEKRERQKACQYCSLSRRKCERSSFDTECDYCISKGYICAERLTKKQIEEFFDRISELENENASKDMRIRELELLLADAEERLRESARNRSTLGFQTRTNSGGSSNEPGPDPASQRNACINLRDTLRNEGQLNEARGTEISYCEGTFDHASHHIHQSPLPAYPSDSYISQFASQSPGPSSFSVHVPLQARMMTNLASFQTSNARYGVHASQPSRGM